MAAWLLGESTAREVATLIAGERRVVASELTVLETDRAIRSGEARGRIPPSAAERMREKLDATVASWGLLPLSAAVIADARRSFPLEPVRALDAVHLATALRVRSALPDLTLLTLDHRIRRNAEALGLAVLP